MQPGDEIASYLGLNISSSGLTALTARPGLCNRGQTLFGGAQLALAILSAERQTQRRALAASIQFVAAVHDGETVDCQVSELARGRVISQCQFFGRRCETLVSSGSVVLTARLDEPTHLARPDNDCAAFPQLPGTLPTSEPNIAHAFEWRAVAATGSGGGRTKAIWMRLCGLARCTPAALALYVDWLPSVSPAYFPGFDRGVSLDNQVRFTGQAPVSAWIRAEMALTAVAGVIASGDIRLFDEADRLIATGSQTFRLVGEAPEQVGRRP